MLRSSFAALLAFIAIGVTSSVANGQCCAPTAVPTVAYSPVVYQQAPAVYNGWYPGKHMINFTRNLFSSPVGYTAGYAPYTVGYAPAYSARYAAYRPTYPVTYGAVQRRAAYAPLTYSVARPVTLAPIASACCNTCGLTTCHGGCNSCGVAQAAYGAPLASSGCSSCQSNGSTYYDSTPASSSDSYSEPRPALDPADNPAADRSLLKPELPKIIDGATEASDASGGAYWQAPPLFDPSDRLTQRNAAPVWFTTHKQPVKTEQGAHQTGASGWTSASR